MVKNFAPILLLFVFGFLTIANAQDEEPRKFTYGLTLNGGGNSSSSDGESVSPTYGMGALIRFEPHPKFFNLIRLDYNLKQEHFANLTHYYYQDGALQQSEVDIYKNYGIINLNYSFNYYIFKNDNLNLFASAGVGMSDMFWLKTRIDIPDNEEEITNGKTQFLYTNPLLRPNFNCGFGILLPYEESKLIAFKPEVNYDYRLPFSRNTYPNFLSYSLRVLLFF